MQRKKLLIRVLAVVIIFFILLIGYFYTKKKTNDRLNEVLERRLQASLSEQQQTSRSFQETVKKAAVGIHTLKVMSPTAGADYDVTERARETLNPF